MSEPADAQEWKAMKSSWQSASIAETLMTEKLSRIALRMLLIDKLFHSFHTK